MRVYEATLIDKWSTPFEGEHSSYQGYVAVGTEEEMAEYPRDDFLPDGFTDDDIHYYFHEKEFEPMNGEIETEEFKYLIGREVAQ